MKRADLIVVAFRELARVVEAAITARQMEDVVAQLRSLGAALRADLSKVERERLDELDRQGGELDADD